MDGFYLFISQKHELPRLEADNTVMSGTTIYALHDIAIFFHRFDGVHGTNHGTLFFIHQQYSYDYTSEFGYYIF